MRSRARPEMDPIVFILHFMAEVLCVSKSALVIRLFEIPPMFYLLGWTCWTG